MFRSLRKCVSTSLLKLWAGYLKWHGVYQFGVGQWEQSRRDFSQALEIQKNVSARVGRPTTDEGKARLNLGNIFGQLGNFTRAIELQQKALVIFREQQKPGLEARALGSLGIAHAGLSSDYSTSGVVSKNSDETIRILVQGIQYLERSLAIFQELQQKKYICQNLQTLGNLYTMRDAYIGGGYSQALNCFQKSVEIAEQLHNRTLIGRAFGSIGAVSIYSGNYEQGIQYWQKSLSIAQQRRDAQDESLALTNLGLAYLYAGQLDIAEQSLRKAVQIRESLRRGLDNFNQVSVLELQQDAYLALQMTLFAQNSVDSELVALEVAEQGRARAFAELLMQQSSKLSAQKLFPKPITRFQIQQIAQELGIFLVEYSILRDEFKVVLSRDGRYRLQELKLVIWVVQPTGQISTHQVDLLPLQDNQTSLYDLIIHFQSFMTAPTDVENTLESSPDWISQSSAQANSCLQELHQLLIAPIYSLISNKPNIPLVFVPQDILFLVPFAALQNSEGIYLIEQHTIFTVPSIQSLQLIRSRSGEKQASIRESLVVGNPTMPDIPLVGTTEPLNSLPWARMEAEAVARLLGSDLITGDDATKIYVKEQMPKAALIHLATHGLLDDIRQLGIPGAIALAPSEKDNGFLTAGEILQMQLNAELVVLSACRTGQGKITGDGVVGLSRSLIAAGASSVIVSLWSVNDESTAFLMVRFYQNYQQGMTPASALKEAQRWLMNVTKSNIQLWAEANQAVLSPTLKTYLLRKINQLSDNERPFYNPRHWAAFYAIGQ